MHGIIRPSEEVSSKPYVDTWHRILGLVRRNRLFLLLVILPSFLGAIYYGLIASDQYESEAHFLVRSSQGSAPAVSGLSALLSFGGSSETRTDAMSVADYLDSSEAVLELDRRIGLAARFQRAGVDPISKLRSDPAPEQLVKYYRKHVTTHQNDRTGIT